MKEKICANAALVRSVAAEQLGVVVGYDQRGVQWLDRYINGQHAQAAPAVKEKLVHTLGSFLGECIRQTYGGEWVVEPDSPYWFIRFADDNAAYPFSKVHKQLQLGADESVLGFFVAIGAMGLAGPKAAPEKAAGKPWWRPW
ncbi:MAG: hypothetical protein V4857_29260 [Pseudomonadota bacterium]